MYCLLWYFYSGGSIVDVSEGKVRIVREGHVNKFVRHVSHLTFNGSYSQILGQRVIFVTERAVFALRDGVVYLDEVAPGISIEQDIMPFIEGGFVVSGSCRPMSDEMFLF